MEKDSKIITQNDSTCQDVPIGVIPGLINDELRSHALNVGVATVLGKLFPAASLSHSSSRWSDWRVPFEDIYSCFCDENEKDNIGYDYTTCNVLCNHNEKAYSSLTTPQHRERQSAMQSIQVLRE